MFYQVSTNFVEIDKVADYNDFVEGMLYFKISTKICLKDPICELPIEYLS